MSSSLTSREKAAEGGGGKGPQELGDDSVPLDRKISDVIVTIDTISDIYKTRTRSDGSSFPALSELEKKCREFILLTEKNNQAKAASKLRPDAPAFLPSFLIKDKVAAAASTASQPTAAPAVSSNTSSPEKTESRRSFPLLPSADPGTDKPPASVNNATKPVTAPVAAKPTSITAHIKQQSPVRDDWDEQLRQEVTEATELVWAQAEAWVDAEIEAEEEEWRILEMGINSYVGLTADSPEPGPPGLEAGTLDHSHLRVNTFFEDPLLDKKNDDKTVRLQTPNRFRLSGCKSARGFLEGRSNSPYLSPPSSSLSARGTLHNKLASPDRRRSMSPSSALKKYEAKQSAAESNRDRSVAVKVQKAMQVSNRVKERMAKAAEKQVQAEEALQDKLKHAEQRHELHINGIRERAGNEAAKVTSALKLNCANSEALAVSLQQKLEDVEARILAASQRREQRLAGISGSQKKKNTKKAQQMSEFKLQLERQKMDRWEKLQQRLVQVQTRREARFAEMKRRAEAETKRLEALAAAHTAEKAERESFGGGTPSRLRPTESEDAHTPLHNVDADAGESGKRSRASSSVDDELAFAFPASPPRAIKGVEVAVPQVQVLSLDSLEQAFTQFTDLQNKAKVSSGNKECWNDCIKKLLLGDNAVNIQQMIDQGHCGVKAMVLGMLVDKPVAHDDRDASASKVYTSIVQEIYEVGLQCVGTAEKINFLVQSALDDANSGQWDRLRDFASSGGALLFTVLLGKDYGVLHDIQSICTFFETSRTNKSAGISQDKVEFGNVMELIRLLTFGDQSIATMLMNHGLHIVMADLSLFLLIFASNKNHKKASESDAAEPVKAVMSGLHVNTVLNSISDVTAHLVDGMLGTKADDKASLQLLMNCLFPCNHLALVVQYGQIVVSELQCELAAMQSNKAANCFDHIVLRAEEGRNALQSVARLTQSYARYISWLRSAAITTSIQVKHWLSLFRRNEVFSLLNNCLALLAEDMSQIVLFPGRHSRSSATPVAPLAVSDHALKLQSLTMAVISGLSAVQEAEPEAFQHLSKDQQIRFLTSLQEILCFYSTSMVTAKPFPSLGGEAPAEVPAGLSREDAVADICTVIAFSCQHSLEARQLVGTVNSTSTNRSTSNSPLSSPGQCSLLLTLASLPIRLMKDQKVKNVLMPCLIVACLEVENNVQIVRRCGKASYVRKYLELAVNERMEWAREGEEGAKKDKLHCLLHLLPADMWEVAQLAWSSGEQVKSAKL